MLSKEERDKSDTIRKYGLSPSTMSTFLKDT